ncbi:hypothetical protein [Brevibacillus borstelensis]|uniref:hypothetical protein n=1 Tax=Brevibacillus borstelensis TaxID=45462 RepID=UPI0030C19FF7
MQLARLTLQERILLAVFLKVTPQASIAVGSFLLRYELGKKYGISNLAERFNKTSWYNFKLETSGLEKGMFGC